MVKVLFVCLGNICRSPMAEFIMKDIINKKGLNNDFYIESAGTSDEEYGNPVYYLAKNKLNSMNISCDNKTARQVSKNDYNKFDYIICMERVNLLNLNRVFNDTDNKTYRLLDFTSNPRDISDPWYTRNFDKCYDEILEGINGFLEYLGYK